MIYDVSYTHITSYINLIICFKEFNQPHTTETDSLRWDGAKLSTGSFSHHVLCCKCNTHPGSWWNILSLQLPLVCHTCDNVVVWCSISQSLPDDLSVSIYGVIFFMFVLLVFVSLLLEPSSSSSSTVQDIWHNLPLISRQCHFITYQKKGFEVSNVHMFELAMGGWIDWTVIDGSNVYSSSFVTDKKFKTYIKAMHAVVKLWCHSFIAVDHGSLLYRSFPLWLNEATDQHCRFLQDALTDQKLSCFTIHVKLLASSLSLLFQSSRDCQN